VHELAVELAARTLAGRRGRLAIVRLSWRTDDPLAVQVGLLSQPDHPALPRGHWVVLRDFLRYGLDEPTGDGDVRFRPDGDLLRIELTREGRCCEVTIPSAPVHVFLDETDARVPSGSERPDAALDILLERLLER
jgi:hypothetical protein